MTTPTKAAPPPAPAPAPAPNQPDTHTDNPDLPPTSNTTKNTDWDTEKRKLAAQSKQCVRDCVRIGMQALTALGARADELTARDITSIVRAGTAYSDLVAHLEADETETLTRAINDANWHITRTGQPGDVPPA